MKGMNRRYSSSIASPSSWSYCKTKKARKHSSQCEAMPHTDSLHVQGGSSSNWIHDTHTGDGLDQRFHGGARACSLVKSFV